MYVDSYMLKTDVHVIYIYIYVLHTWKTLPLGPPSPHRSCRPRSNASAATSGFWRAASRCPWRRPSRRHRRHRSAPRPRSIRPIRRTSRPLRSQQVAAALSLERYKEGLGFRSRVKGLGFRVREVYFGQRGGAATNPNGGLRY